jgi:hypothetical protein
LRWVIHVERTPEERDVKKIYKWKLIASKPVGRPKTRRMDTVMKGILAMKTVNWESVNRTERNGSQLLRRPKLL